MSATEFCFVAQLMALVAFDGMAVSTVGGIVIKFPTVPTFVLGSSISCNSAKLSVAIKIVPLVISWSSLGPIISGPGVVVSVFAHISFMLFFCHKPHISGQAISSNSI